MSDVSSDVESEVALETGELLDLVDEHQRERIRDNLQEAEEELRELKVKNASLKAEKERLDKRDEAEREMIENKKQELEDSDLPEPVKEHQREKIEEEVVEWGEEYDDKVEGLVEEMNGVREEIREVRPRVELYEDLLALFDDSE